MRSHTQCSSNVRAWVTIELLVPHPFEHIFLKHHRNNHIGIQIIALHRKIQLGLKNPSITGRWSSSMMAVFCCGWDMGWTDPERGGRARILVHVYKGVWHKILGPAYSENLNPPTLRFDFTKVIKTDYLLRWQKCLGLDLRISYCVCFPLKILILNTIAM